METKWSTGFTIMTQNTRSWSKEEILDNDSKENLRVYSDFNLGDEGRSRKLVCTLNPNHPDYVNNSLKITAVNDLLNACIMARNAISAIANDGTEPANNCLIAIDAAIKKATNK